MQHTAKEKVRSWGSLGGCNDLPRGVRILSESAHCGHRAFEPHLQKRLTHGVTRVVPLTAGATVEE